MRVTHPANADEKNAQNRAARSSDRLIGSRGCSPRPPGGETDQRRPFNDSVLWQEMEWMEY